MHLLPLYAERFVVAVSPSHRLAALAEIRLADLEGESYLNRANCEYKDYLRERRERQGVQIKYMYASERDDWIQCMAMAGLGFTLIPEFAVTVPGLVTRPLIEPEVQRHVKLVTVRGRPHSPAVGAFVHEARRYPWSEKLRQPPSPGPGLVAA
jgi:LysR family transcriptional regulator, hydrogen peroxide-inducible genes activator